MSNTPVVHNVLQGTDEWHAARRGLITASEMHHLLTPTTLKPSNNDKTRAHIYELAAQRITGYTEPTYIGDHMLRGQADEIRARDLYSRTYAPVTECGFMTREVAPGVVLGYSPDGLVGEDGLIECKSRMQKYQVQTILETVMGTGKPPIGDCPDEFLLQVQTGLLVSGRKWCDFISYCGGMPMFVVRMFAYAAIQEAILSAATETEKAITRAQTIYISSVRHHAWPATERVTEGELLLCP